MGSVVIYKSLNNKESPFQLFIFYEQISLGAYKTRSAFHNIIFIIYPPPP